MLVLNIIFHSWLFFSIVGYFGLSLLLGGLSLRQLGLILNACFEHHITELTFFSIVGYFGLSLLLSGLSLRQLGLILNACFEYHITKLAIF